MERSSDGGSIWSDVTTGLSPSTTSYTDTTVSKGVTYTYRIERNTNHATSTSGTTSVDTGFDIYIDGDQVKEITIDGTSVTEVTIDGTGV